MLKFSVLMSLYHAESPNYLNDCFASLYSQSILPNEIILVIDGPISIDLMDIVRHWSVKLNIIKYQLHENVGLGKALNFGLEKCNYELVARMDTDDICVEQRFETQLSEFEKNPSLTITGSNIMEVDSESLKYLGHRRVPCTNDSISKMMVYKNPFNHMTVMYRKADVISVGSYKDLQFMEDWFLWIRLFSNGFKGGNVSTALVNARTGKNMIKRRSGLSYIVCEFNMAKVKHQYKVSNLLVITIVFFIRSLPRMLPIWLLTKIYSLSRL
jgi:glycosyltransferase involved in cell wall biosynthesis